MSILHKRILEFIKIHYLVKKKDKVLVALSGGADSVFLLDLFYKIKVEYKLSIAVAHVNHLLRGVEAERDELFCKKKAEKYSTEFFLLRKNIQNVAEDEKKSIEDAGRTVRYSFFEKIAEENNFDKIAIAHNKSDNAETIIYNLTKGTGLKGASGIPIVRGKIIRPLLCISSDDIREYLKSNNIEYINDSSNFSNDFTRNFIRNEILYSLKEKINPKIEDAFFRFSEITRNTLEFNEKLLSILSKEYVFFENKILRINKTFINLVGYNYLGSLLKLLTKKYFEVDLSLINTEVNLTENDVFGKQFDLKNNLLLFNDREYLIIKEKNDGFFEVSLKVNEYFENEKFTIKITEVNKNSVEISSGNLIEYIDGENLENEFVLRTWKQGDKFIPFGMNKQKLISDFLTDEKIPLFNKKTQLVLINRNNIIWVVGLRIDNRYKIKTHSKTIYKIEVKYKDK